VPGAPRSSRELRPIGSNLYPNLEALCGVIDQVRGCDMRARDVIDIAGLRYDPQPAPGNFTRILGRELRPICMNPGMKLAGRCSSFDVRDREAPLVVSNLLREQGKTWQRQCQRMRRTSGCVKIRRSRRVEGLKLMRRFVDRPVLAARKGPKAPLRHSRSAQSHVQVVATWAGPRHLRRQGTSRLLAASIFSVRLGR
jgi:hypothetical protein